MIKNIKSICVLVAICSVMGLLLAVTNHIAAPIIEQRLSDTANAALTEMFPGGQFEVIDLSQYDNLPDSVVKAHKETSGQGYVIDLNFKCYKEGMQLTFGINADGSIRKIQFIDTKDDRKAEAMAYGDSFVGKTIETYDEVDTISGSTITTKGYKQGVKDALNAAAIFGGADVDTRTPEQILADNLTAALPAGEGKFTKMFFTEQVEGVDAVYSADNGAGFVAVIGEEFVAVNSDGSSSNAVASTAVKALIASTSTTVDLTAYEGVNENVVSVDKTATGNYIVVINARGYAYYDDNHGYGQQRFVPIVIRVSLTADGKIIDCLTVSHEESTGIGDVCATEEFYSQFDGKTIDTYTEVDGIAGATITTEGPKGNEGYMAAILRCFETVSILEGGAK